VVMRHQLRVSQCQVNCRHFYIPGNRVMPAALSRVLPLASVDSVPGPFGGGFGTRRPLPVLAAAARIGLAAGLEFGGPRVLH
jgi:hypothetical protein